MFFANQSDPFYLVSGSESGLPSQFITGNIPFLADEKILRSLILGAVLLLIASIAYSLVKKQRSLGAVTKRQLVCYNLLIFMGFFSTWEAFLHLPFFASQRVFIPDPFTFWKVNPAVVQQQREAKIDKGEVQVVTSEKQRVEGLFDLEYKPEKPKNTYRIVCTGDSQAVLVNYTSSDIIQTYPKLLQTNIREEGLKGPLGQNIEVINGAMVGFSSWQGLMLLKSHILSYKPDLVIEAFGYHDSNDAFALDREIITDDYITHRIRQTMYSSNLCLMFRTLCLRRQAKQIDFNEDVDRIQRSTPLQLRENLRDMDLLGKENGFKMIYLIEPMSRSENLRPRCQPYRQAIIEQGKESGVEVINLAEKVNSLPDDQYDSMFVDFIHLTAKGHRYFAKEIEQKLKDMKILSSSRKMNN